MIKLYLIYTYISFCFLKLFAFIMVFKNDDKSINVSAVAADTFTKTRINLINFPQYFSFFFFCTFHRVVIRRRKNIILSHYVIEYAMASRNVLPFNTLCILKILTL